MYRENYGSHDYLSDLFKEVRLANGGEESSKYCVLVHAGVREDIQSDILVPREYVETLLTTHRGSNPMSEPLLNMLARNKMSHDVEISLLETTGLRTAVNNLALANIQEGLENIGQEQRPDGAEALNKAETVDIEGQDSNQQKELSHEDLPEVTIEKSGSMNAETAQETEQETENVQDRMERVECVPPDKDLEALPDETPASVDRVPQSEQEQKVFEGLPEVGCNFQMGADDVEGYQGGEDVNFTGFNSEYNEDEGDDMINFGGNLGDMHPEDYENESLGNELTLARSSDADETEKSKEVDKAEDAAPYKELMQPPEAPKESEETAQAEMSAVDNTMTADETTTADKTTTADNTTTADETTQTADTTTDDETDKSKEVDKAEETTQTDKTEKGKEPVHAEEPLTFEGIPQSLREMSMLLYRKGSHASEQVHACGFEIHDFARLMTSMFEAVTITILPKITDEEKNALVKDLITINSFIDRDEDYPMDITLNLGSGYFAKIYKIAAAHEFTYPVDVQYDIVTKAETLKEMLTNSERCESK